MVTLYIFAIYDNSSTWFLLWTFRPQSKHCSYTLCIPTFAFVVHCPRPQNPFCEKTKTTRVLCPNACGDSLASALLHVWKDR